MLETVTHCYGVHSDAKGMATGVHEVLAEMLVEFEHIDKVEAMKTLTKWITEKKYLRDLVRDPCL